MSGDQFTGYGYTFLHSEKQIHPVLGNPAEDFVDQPYYPNRFAPKSSKIETRYFIYVIRTGLNTITV